MIIVISWNVGKYDRTKLTLNMKGIEKNWRGILNKVIQDFSQFGSGSTSVGSPNAMHELEVILDILQQLVSFSLSCKGVGNSNSNLESLHLPDMKLFSLTKFLLLKTVIFQTMMMIITRGSSLIGCLAEIRSGSRGQDKYELHIIFNIFKHFNIQTFKTFLKIRSEWIKATG